MERKIEIMDCVTGCKKTKKEKTWEWLARVILWFIFFTVLFWLIYYSIKPSFVTQPETNQVDTAKVLLYAVISSILLIILVWIIKYIVDWRKNYVD